MIMLHDLKNVIYLPHEDLSTLLHSWYKRKDNLNYLYNTTIGSTDQDMLASDCSPIHPRLIRQGRFKPCLLPGYFLLQS